MYKRILIPTDGSKCSELAIVEGLNLAKALSANVTFLYAVEDPIRTVYMAPQVASYHPEIYEAAKQAGHESLEAALKLATEAAVEARTVLAERKSPDEAILEEEKNADLVVIGTHGRRGFNRFMFGSVAEAVIRRTSTPCLIVRSEKNKEAQDNA